MPPNVSDFLSATHRAAEASLDASAWLRTSVVPGAAPRALGLSPGDALRLAPALRRGDRGAGDVQRGRRRPAGLRRRPVEVGVSRRKRNK